MRARAILSSFLFVAAASSFAQEQIFYFKEPRRIAAIPGESAVWLKPGVESLLVSSTGTPAAIRGWHYLNMPPSRQLQAALPASSFITPVYREANGSITYPTQEILVQFVPELTTEQCLARIYASLPVSAIQTDYVGLRNAFKVLTSYDSGVSVLRAARGLALREDTIFAESDMVFFGSAAYIPNDPNFGQSWGLNNTGQNGGVTDKDMDAPEAWNTTRGSGLVNVVIIDTGVQQGHPDIWQTTAKDFTTDNGDGGPVNQYDNHGTAVAGCISQKMDNSLFTCGIAPLCPTLSARCFIGINSSGGWSAEYSWTADALAWAESHFVEFSNNSNFYGSSSSVVTAKYNDLYNANKMVHFASAGNNGSSVISYPASLANVNAVGATTNLGTKASFSNFGSALDLATPGVGILSTDRTGTAGYTSGSEATVQGTSFASPYAAGVAALTLSQNPFLTVKEVETLVRTNTDDYGSPGFDTSFGWGCVNANKAVTSANSIRLKGKLVFDGYAGHVPSEVQLELRKTDGVTAVWSHTVNPIGWQFDILVPLGNYTLSCRPARFLRRTIPVIGMVGGTRDNDLVLLPGDADGDNAVTLLDYDVFNLAFDSVLGETRYNVMADFNGDNQVNLLDYDLFSQNFDKSGDPE